MLGIVITQKCFVQTASFFPFHHVHFFAVATDLAKRIFGGVVHGCGSGHGAGIKGLNLVCAETIFLQPNGQVHHVFVAGSRVRGNEVRYQKLFLARLRTELVKHAFELVVGANAGLHHLA